jgi:two-component system, OmpR family, KDP operon response regulator KdpE
MAMSSAGTHILVIEDERAIRQFVRASLVGHGYHVTEAATGTAGVFHAIMQTPDVVVLDLGLPDIDGLEVIRRIRESFQVPIIVISARGQNRDEVEALNAGANDYLSKPFDTDELLKRIDALVRHAMQPSRNVVGQVFAVDHLRVDFSRRTVSVDDREVTLSATEYGILFSLIVHAGSIVTLDQLCREIGGPNGPLAAQQLRTSVAQLRRKIETDVARPRYLLSEPGVGYRLAVT